MNLIVAFLRRGFLQVAALLMDANIREQTLWRLLLKKRDLEKFKQIFERRGSSSHGRLYKRGAP